MFIRKEEKERRVIDLYYRRGKTFREIVKELRVSPNYISAVIKKKEEEQNNNSIVTNNRQRSSSSLSSKAYELFSEGKRLVKVAIALNLREPEVTKMYREYWKLNRLDKLNSIYKETNDKLGPFLKLYRLIKEKGMNIYQVVNDIEIADNRLPHMESLYKQAKDEVDKMQRTGQQLENYLRTLNDEIANAKALLNSYHMLCERKRQELEHLNNDTQ